MAELMTPDCLRWDEFVKKLKRKLNRSACNNDYSFSRKILTKMGDVDIDASIEFFKENGGHCDCEVILNTANVDGVGGKITKADEFGIRVRKFPNTWLREYHTIFKISEYKEKWGLAGYAKTFFEAGTPEYAKKLKMVGGRGLSLSREVCNMEGVHFLIIHSNMLSVQLDDKIKSPNPEWKKIQPQILEALKKCLKD